MIFYTHDKDGLYNVPERSGIPFQITGRVYDVYLVTMSHPMDKDSPIKPSDFSTFMIFYKTNQSLSAKYDFKLPRS